VDKNGEGIMNSDFHLVCYKVRSKRKLKQLVRVTNQFGEQSLLIYGGRNRKLCVPSLKEVVRPLRSWNDQADDRYDAESSDDWREPRTRR
jgi:hypothetical protein